MKKTQFLARRKPVWRQFELLVTRLDARGMRKLSPEELTSFSRLFRETCFDLSLIRSRDWGADVAAYLNGLVIRGHDCFHQARPARMGLLWWFVTTGFPRVWRANIWYFVAAAALFFVPLGVSWGAIQYDPGLASLVIDSEAREQMEEMYSKDIAEDGWKHFGENRAGMAGFYIWNNVSIAWQCFAHGILLGIGTVYILLSNGIQIGAVAGYLVAMGHGERFLSFVISHGSFELTAIAVAGGGGLMLGDALLRPGRRTRLESLRVRGSEALQIAGGAGIMLGIAALIEAFWSPSPLPPHLKYVVGSILWVVVFLYLALAGHEWKRAAA